MEEEQEIFLHKTTKSERLDGFAEGHFTISLVGAMIGLPAGLVLVGINCEALAFIVLPVLTAAAMMVYVYAGAYKARTCGWTVPKGIVEIGQAILLPALIAWAWGGLVLCCYLMSGDGWGSALVLLLPGSFLCAFPSFLLVFAALIFGFLDAGINNMILCVLLAGGLPPALFVLGSIFGVQKKQREVPQE